MAVYFAKNTSNGLIKIGTSKKVQKRLETISWQEVAPMELLRTIEGSYAEEAFMHMHFGEFNIRGEWFSFSEEMMTFELPNDWQGILAEHRKMWRLELTMTDEQKAMIQKAAAAAQLKPATWAKAHLMLKAMEAKQ